MPCLLLQLSHQIPSNNGFLLLAQGLGCQTPSSRECSQHSLQGTRHINVQQSGRREERGFKAQTHNNSHFPNFPPTPLHSAPQQPQAFRPELHTRCPHSPYWI